jgi:FAD/FMN-containing dehydrogenase
MVDSPYGNFPSWLHAHYAVLEADSDIVVQAGCQWQDINQTLQERGIIFIPCSSNLLNLRNVRKGIPLFFPVSYQYSSVPYYHAETVSA